MKRQIFLTSLAFFIAFASFGQTINPKKNYYGKGLTSRFLNSTHAEIKSHDFAEVLNTAVLLTNATNDAYVCKIFACDNGASDPELDYCNNSTNYYVSNGKYDLPNEYKLFKIGPFYTIDTAFISTGSQKETYIFTIRHRRVDKKFTNRYLITFGSIALLKD